MRASVQKDLYYVILTFIGGIFLHYHMLYSYSVPQGQGVFVRCPLGLNAPMAS